MSTIVKAEKRPQEFYWEVCPSLPGECPHTNPGADHRTYIWSRRFEPVVETTSSVEATSGKVVTTQQIIGQKEVTLPAEAQMLQEITILEAQRNHAPLVGDPLPQQGTELS